MSNTTRQHAAHETEHFSLEEIVFSLLDSSAALLISSVFKHFNLITIVGFRITIPFPYVADDCERYNLTLASDFLLKPSEQIVSFNLDTYFHTYTVQFSKFGIWDKSFKRELFPPN